MTNWTTYWKYDNLKDRCGAAFGGTSRCAVAWGLRFAKVGLAEHEFA
jgi:hypothetical protein